MLVLNFAIFYSVSTLLAVWTRSTVACVFGTILFWFLCWGMNYGRHAVVALPASDPAAARVRSELSWVVETGYWILPKPLDLSILLSKALHAEDAFGEFRALELVERKGAFHLGLSVLASLGFTVGVLAVAARQLVTTDY